MTLGFEFEGKRMKPQIEEQQKVKLPKLQISKFDGTVTDWVQFWKKFEEKINKCKHYTAIKKVSYLRELL